MRYKVTWIELFSLSDNRAVNGVSSASFYTYAQAQNYAIKMSLDKTITIDASSFVLKSMTALYNGDSVEYYCQGEQQ